MSEAQPVASPPLQQDHNQSQAFSYEEGELVKELSEAVITEPVEDGGSLKEAVSLEAQGVPPCTSPISVQQEVAKDSEAFLKIVPVANSCPTAEGAKGIQNNNSVEDSESKSSRIEESVLDLKPKQFRLTSHQRKELEAVFTKTFYVTVDKKEALAADLGLSYKQVATYFRNRRKSLKKRVTASSFWIKAPGVQELSCGVVEGKQSFAEDCQEEKCLLVTETNLLASLGSHCLEVEEKSLAAVAGLHLPLAGVCLSRRELAHCLARLERVQDLGERVALLLTLTDTVVAAVQGMGDLNSLVEQLNIVKNLGRKWKVFFSALRPMLPCPTFPPTSLAAIHSALGRCHLALQAVLPELASHLECREAGLVLSFSEVLTLGETSGSSAPAESCNRSAANPVAKLKTKLKRVRGFQELNSKRTKVRKCQGSEDEKTSSLSTTTVEPKKLSSKKQQFSLEEQRILLDNVLDSKRVESVQWEVRKPAFWQTGMLPDRSWKGCRNAFYHLCHKIKAGESNIQLSKEQLALLYSLRLERLRPTPVSTSTVQPKVKDNLEGLRRRYPGIRISFTPSTAVFKKDCEDFSSSGGKETTRTSQVKKKINRNMVPVSRRKLLKQAVRQKKALNKASVQPFLLPKPSLQTTPSSSKTHCIQQNPNLKNSPSLTPIQPKLITSSPLTPTLARAPTPAAPMVAGTGTPDKQNTMASIKSFAPSPQGTEPAPYAVSDRKTGTNVQGFTHQEQKLVPSMGVTATPNTAKKIFVTKDGKVVRPQVSNSGTATPSKVQPGTKQKVQLVKNANGKIEVRGLLQGQ